MTKEFIESEIDKAKANASYHEREANRYLNGDTVDKHAKRAIEFHELADYLSQHPVMQEGKVISIPDLSSIHNDLHHPPDAPEKCFFPGCDKHKNDECDKCSL